MFPPPRKVCVKYLVLGLLDKLKHCIKVQFANVQRDITLYKSKIYAKRYFMKTADLF